MDTYPTDRELDREAERVEDMARAYGHAVAVEVDGGSVVATCADCGATAEVTVRRGHGTDWLRGPLFDAECHRDLRAEWERDRERAARRPTVGPPPARPI